MKIKKGFILREFSETMNVVVGVGENATKINGYLTLNATGVIVWKTLEKGATVDEIVAKILEEYDADKSVVEADVLSVISTLKKIGAIDD